MLSERVTHLKELGEHYDSKDAGIIHGKIPGKDRPGILSGYPIVFAVTQLARDGLDRSDLDTVMVTLPFTDRGRFEQIIGRAQRVKKPIIVIFEDEKIGPCRNMCRRLKTHLRDLQYPFYTTDQQTGD